MEDLREDRMLSDLFRQKLENAEITPSPSLRLKSDAQGRNEGIPAFQSIQNQYLVCRCCSAAAGTALALILTQSPDKQRREIQEPLPVEIYKEAADNNVKKDLSAPVISIRRITWRLQKTGKKLLLRKFQNQLIIRKQLLSLPEASFSVSRSPESKYITNDSSIK